MSRRTRTLTQEQTLMCLMEACYNALVACESASADAQSVAGESVAALVSQP